MRHPGGVSVAPDQDEYGPRGYLPERAARRARKIVLRGRMGIGWPLAAVGAAVLVATVGIAFLLRVGPPGPPYRAAGSLTAVAPASAEVLPLEGPQGGVLVVRAEGTVRAFTPPPTPVAWCGATRRLESATGQVWTGDGVLVGGDGTSLRSLPSSVYDGVVYVDPTDPGAVLPSDPRGEAPGCS
jgi:hypothetical protein